MAVPFGTSAAIFKRLNGEVAEVDIKTTADVSKLIAAELIQWAKVAKDAGMKVE